MKKLSIGLVCDLRKDYRDEGFAEEDVAEFDSESTAESLESAIRSCGYRIERIGHGRALASALVKGRRWDLVFNIAEGVHGRSREAQVPALLELFDIPYTFSDPLVSAVTLDKAVAKRLVREAGLRTPAHFVVETPADIGQAHLSYPLFAKPIAEGTGKGIDVQSRIDTASDLTKVCRRLLRRYHQPVLVEEFLPGREFTTAILGTDSKARVLGTMEIAVRDPKRKAIYSFETKEECDSLITYSSPPRNALRRRVEELALASYRTLQCRDAGRVDIRLDRRGSPNFMEVNPMPGLHPHHSDLPMIATQEGMGYNDLIGSIIRSALTRRKAGP